MTLAKFFDECYMFCDLLLLHMLKPAAEWVFSLLSNSFKENQQNTLEDYISTSVMLQGFACRILATLSNTSELFQHALMLLFCSTRHHLRSTE